VGDREITVGEFRSAYEAIAPADRPDLDDPEARSQFLQDIINKNLLELAAWETYPELTQQQQWRVERLTKTRLRSDATKRMVADQVSVTEADKDAAFARMQKDLRIDGMLLPSREMAETMMERIEKGRSFEDLCVEYSIHEAPDADKPWDLGWRSAGNFDFPMEVAVWVAPMDKVVGPLEDKGSFWLIRVTDSRSVPAEDSREALDARLDMVVRQPVYLARQKFVQDSLRTAANPRFPDEGRDLLMAKYYWEPPEALRDDPMAYLNDPRVKPSFTAEEESVIVVQFDNATDWTAQEYADLMEWYPTGTWIRGQTHVQFNECMDMILREFLYLKAALDFGLDKDEEYIAAMDNRKNQMRVTYMYNRNVIGNVVPTEADIQVWFEENRDRYKASASYRVASFGSADGELMKQLASDWKSGMKFSEIQDKYEPLTGDLQPIGDSNWIHEGQDPGLDDHLAPIKEGGVADPFTRNDMHYVLKILGRRGERLVAYEEAKEIVDKDAATMAKERALQAFLDEQTATFGVVIQTEALESVDLSDLAPAEEDSAAL